MARARKEPTLLQKLKAAKVKKDLAAAQYDELAAEARETFTMGAHSEPGVTVQIQRNRTWDKKRAELNFGVDVCSMQVDLEVAKKFLTGNEFDELYIEGPNKVIVKVTS